MNVITVLNEIERLAEGMVNLPQCEQAERVRDYATIRVLIQELDELQAKENAKQHIKDSLQKLKQCCRNLAGLGEECAPPDRQMYSDTKDVLHALRTQFGIENSQ